MPHHKLDIKLTLYLESRIENLYEFMELNGNLFTSMERYFLRSVKRISLKYPDTFPMTYEQREYFYNLELRTKQALNDNKKQERFEYLRQSLYK